MKDEAKRISLARLYSQFPGSIGDRAKNADRAPGKS